MDELRGDGFAGLIVAIVGIAWLTIQGGGTTLIYGITAVGAVAGIVIVFTKVRINSETTHKFHSSMTKEAKHEIKDEQKEKQSEKQVATKEIDEYKNEQKEYKDAQDAHAYITDEKKLTYHYAQLKDPKVLEKVVNEVHQVALRFKDMGTRLTEDYQVEKECYHEEMRDIAKLKKESNAQKEERSIFSKVETKDDIKIIKESLKYHKNAIDDEIRLEKLIRIDEHLIHDSLHIIKEVHILIGHQIKLIKNFDKMPSGEFYTKLEEVIGKIDNRDKRVAGLITRRSKITHEIMQELKKIRDDLSSIQKEEVKVIRFEKAEDKEDGKIKDEVSKLAA